MTDLFVRLEIGWLDNPKIVTADMAVRGLHATVLLLAKRGSSDGWVDRSLLRREGADDGLIDRAVEAGLLDVDGPRVRPSGWLDRNPSQSAIDAIRATKAEAARRGNHKRWHGTGPVDECEKCQVSRISDTGAIRCDPTRSPETETETDIPDTSLRTTHNPEPGSQTSDDDQQQPDDQTLRRTAALIARTVAERSATGSPSGYAARVRAEILTGPDPTDRDRIAAALAAGDAPEAIAAAWVPDPLAVVLGPIPTSPPPDPAPRPRLQRFDPAANAAAAEAQRAAFEAAEAHR